MGDMLSQAEIDALLGGTASESEEEALETEQHSSSNAPDPLTDEEKDALGEIGNISMGTAATTLFTLLNQKVTITTPRVKVVTWDEISQNYKKPCVAINVEYKEGLIGANLLVLKESDVKIIADLMMGGDGTNIQEELSELHLSAISEAMNQMIGSSSTSISSMFNKKIDISPPHAFVMNFDNDHVVDDVGFGEEGVVRIAFRMEIGDLIDSEIMQILPLEFAKDMVENLMHSSYSQPEIKEVETSVEVAEQPSYEQMPSMPQPQTPVIPPTQQQPMNYQQSQMEYQVPPMMMPQQQTSFQQNVNAQPAQFQNFDMTTIMQQKENIDIIMDVPLEVTVELGRTHKLIKEILEFSPGTIIELDKLAGEPIDILVNGKFIAKGEVVVIDENFGIRITDIISPENRI